MPPRDTITPAEIRKLHENEKYDLRYPHFIGFWRRSVPGIDDGPRFDIFDQPHKKRRDVILREYPEMKKLTGYDTNTIWITLISVMVQMTSCYVFGRILTDWNWTMFLVAYIMGGSISTQIGVIFHEFSHDLCAESIAANRWVGMIGNIPLLVPLAQSFRRYHLQHHQYQGVYGFDPDIPLDWEVRLIGNNPIRKFIWLVIYGFMYIGRGLAQQKQLTKWELYNWAWTFACDLVIWKTCGLRGILYLVISIALGFGIHVGAAHFIQEHYTFRDGQETYSYYGSGNYFWLNIGYHNEHHDFQLVPWTKLPEIRRIAPEYYDDLAYHTSWWAVLYMFLTSSLLAPQSRVVRTLGAHRYAQKHLKVRPMEIPKEEDDKFYKQKEAFAKQTEADYEFMMEEMKAKKEKIARAKNLSNRID